MTGTRTRRAVAAIDRRTPLAALLLDAEPALAAWYAEPLAPRPARMLLEMARRKRQACLCRGESCFRLEVLQLVCHYWLNSNAELQYRQLASLATDDAGRSLLELVYGQLLISSKLQAARRHLDRGFSLAASRLDPADYFALLRRHERLGWLHLMESPARPAPLQALLNEAAVIAQLAGGRRRTPARMHYDTVG
jgi:hypothetical protein